MARETIRIGLVAPTMGILGGHAVQAARMLEGWRDDSEIQVRLLPIDPPVPRGLVWLSKIRILRTLLNQVRYWPFLLREVPRVDVVHVFCPSNSSFLMSALPAIVVGHLYDRPVIANHRGDSPQRVVSSPTLRRLVASVAVNVAPSAYYDDVFRDRGIHSQIIPNLCDLAQFKYRARDPIRPALISTRNFEPIYNVACTLRAFSVVQARYADASLVVVGDGRQRAALESLARELGLRHVTFAGRVPHEAIHHLYDAADIYVQTPVLDNMPASVIEAFASGLPVVSTQVGGVPEILEHGVHGLLAPSNDHEAVAASILTILEQQDDARRMAAAAFTTCQRYTWSAVCEKWRDVYRSVNRTHRPLEQT